MILSEDKALKIAEFLLQIKAVKLSPEKPFTWASGWQSPIYCDNRITLSHPRIRTFIRQGLSEDIVSQFGKPDAIAGVATAGIPQGALVAQELDIPFIYVRSSSKGHGMQNKIEGVLEKGQNIVVIEDLISTGKSSIDAIDALKEAGANVKGLAAIFTYGFKVSVENFEKANCPFITLSNYDYLIDQAIKSNYINENQKETLQAWKLNPSTWNKG